MKRNSSIQLKAAVLLTVFSLNTVVGFACSLRLDMEFNTTHHEEEVIKPSVHIHANGKKHEHQKTDVKPTVHVHANGEKHEHQHEPVKHDSNEEKTVPQKDNEGCCKDDAVNFQNLDKNINIKTAINAPALIAVISSFLGIEISQVPDAEKQLYTARYLFPPPPNILISIQRFQI